MNQTITAVVGQKGRGKTGGEQYNTRLLCAAVQAGFEINYLTWQGSWFNRLMGLPLLWRLRHITQTMSLTWSLWRSSGDVFIDVWLAPYVCFWAKRTPRKIYLMVHHLRGVLEQDIHVQQAEAVLIQSATHILTVSQSSKQQIQNYLKRDISIDIIPPGFVRPKGIMHTKKASQSAVQLLFVGHITKAKGILDLICAVSLLPRDHSWHLDIVGGASAEPETLKKVKYLLKKNNLQSYVQLHGRVENYALQGFYQHADIFVLPSYWEGYGIVFLEAMSLGLPIVATTAGAIPEVVAHQQSGLLIDIADIQGLLKALQTLIDDPNIRKQLAIHAKNSANESADWQSIEKRFVSWWQKQAEDAC